MSFQVITRSSAVAEIGGHFSGPRSDFGHLSSSSSWREAISRSIPPLRFAAKTICPHPAREHQSPIFPCPGGSDGSMWWEVSLERTSSRVMAGRRLELGHLGHYKNLLIDWLIDHTAYIAWYSYRLFVVWNSRGQHEYFFLFTVSIWSLLLMPVSLLADFYVLWLYNTSYSNSFWGSE